MQNYNKQQQSIILKGIAQNILQMSVPDFSQLDLQLRSFDRTVLSIDDAYPEEFYVLHQGHCSRHPLKDVPGGGFSIAKFATKEEAFEFAKTECNFHYGKYNDHVGSHMKPVEYSTNFFGKTGFGGWRANGRYWEVHTKPEWLP